MTFFSFCSATVNLLATQDVLYLSMRSVMTVAHILPIFRHLSKSKQTMLRILFANMVPLSFYKRFLPRSRVLLDVVDEIAYLDVSNKLPSLHPDETTEPHRDCVGFHPSKKIS